MFVNVIVGELTSTTPLADCRSGEEYCLQAPEYVNIGSGWII